MPHTCILDKMPLCVLVLWLTERSEEKGARKKEKGERRKCRGSVEFVIRNCKETLCNTVLLCGFCIVGSPKEGKRSEEKGKSAF